MRKLLPLILGLLAVGCSSGDPTAAKSDAAMRSDLSKRSNPKDLPPDVQAKMSALSKGGK